MSHAETIFALSSGSPPAGIGVVRISGPDARSALQQLGGRVPAPRRAKLMTLRDPADDTLVDEALVLFLPGPANATGEDCVELHLHGGRAIVARALAVLATLKGLRPAQPGEFTLRAFRNGRIDLAEAEGLADLLSAETELQLRNAQAVQTGALSRQANRWRDAVLEISARVETALDFSDEDDGAQIDTDFSGACRDLAESMAEWLDTPQAETLRDGFRVVIGGPPNAGKSSLFNALLQDEAAIATPIAGTTRDVLHRPVSFDGVPFLFVDTAGLRDNSDDPIEMIGIERAGQEIGKADLVLWLGPNGEGPEGAWEIATGFDLGDTAAKTEAEFRVSCKSGENIAALRQALIKEARTAMPKPGQIALNVRQRQMIGDAAEGLQEASHQSNLLLVAEGLRRARSGLDRLLGNVGTEDMLDALFGRFCIGK